MEDLNFSLTLKTVSVTLDDKAYLLKEMTGGDRDKYLSTLGAKLSYGPDGKPTGLKSFDGLQSHGLSLCLYYEESGKKVPITVINQFPAAVQDSLWKAAQELSAIDQESVDEMGND